ncbi:AZOBR_p60025 family cell surface glycopolymer formation protein [Prochlorothrix hollandica]|uniref:AZOBR_p60025 family cell surface glycopolymer formation protein n=1 Tax=Prochlorothrix hollandica TaxID=1223 RepID=UPI003342C879
MAGLQRSRLFWLITFLVPAIAVGLFWGLGFDGEITGFFRIGSEFPHSPYLNLNTARIVPGEVGHDGQQFLSIALDPGLQNPGTIEALDLPAYRYRRIFYPLLGYLLAFGQRFLIPYTLVFLNYVAIVAIVLLGSAFLEHQGNNPNHSLWLLGIPGFWISLSLGTAELVSSALLLGSLYCYQQRRFTLTSILLMGGCLTRETLLIMGVAIGVTGLWERLKTKELLTLWSAGLPILLWSVYVEKALGSGLQQAASNNLGFPLGGLLVKISTSISLANFSIEKLYDLYNFSLILLAFSLLLFIHWKTLGNNKIISLCSAVLTTTFACLTPTVLGYYADYVRTFSDVYILLVLSTPLAFSLNQQTPWMGWVYRGLVSFGLPIASVGIWLSVSIP